LLCAAGCLLAQTQDNSSQIRIGVVPYTPIAAHAFTAETRLVEIPAVVRDAHDRPVPGLTRADFSVYDSGKLRAITSLSAVDARVSSPVSAAPERPKRFVALVIDDLFVIPADGCGARVSVDLWPFFAAATQMRAPAEELFKESLRSGDQISLFGFLEGQVLPFESDAAAFHQALDRMTIHTICADVDIKLRMLEDIEDYLAPMPGDRSILLTSRSIVGRPATVSRVIARALKYGITINTLDAAGLRVESGGGAGGVPGGGRGVTLGARGAPVGVGGGVPRTDVLTTADVLTALADDTGGTYFHNSNDFTGGMKELALAPPGSYLLGIATDGAQDGRYHALKVKTAAGLRYSVKARRGYYAEDARKAAPSLETQLAEIVSGSEIRQELPVTFAVAPRQPEDPPQGLTVVLNIDIPHLPFHKENGRRQQTLTMVAALDDDQGNFVTGGKGSIVFDLKETTYAEMVKRGKPLALEMKLGAPAGRYRLRTVLREDGASRITAASQTIELKAAPPAGEGK